MRKREAIQPRKSYRAEADTFLLVAGSNTAVDMRECRRFRRGQRACKEVSAYLGGLISSWNKVRAI